MLSLQKVLMVSIFVLAITFRLDAQTYSLSGLEEPPVNTAISNNLVRTPFFIPTSYCPNKDFKLTYRIGLDVLLPQVPRFLNDPLQLEKFFILASSYEDEQEFIGLYHLGNEQNCSLISQLDLTEGRCDTIQLDFSQDQRFSVEICQKEPQVTWRLLNEILVSINVDGDSYYLLARPVSHVDIEISVYNESFHKEEHFLLSQTAGQIYINNNSFKVNNISFTGQGLIEVENINETGLFHNIDQLLTSSYQTPFDQSYMGLQFGEELTIFHFWGPWCAPCLDELPEWSRLESSLNMSNKFDLVNVCVLQSIDNLSDLENLINRNQVSNNQVLQEISSAPNNNIITKSLSVVAYPTTIILDKTGKELFRGSGFNDEFKSFLNLHEIDFD